MSGRLAIDGELTIQTASARHAELLAALGSSDQLDIDLAGVVEVDSAGLQLLLAARKSALAAGKELRLVNASLTVLEALEFLALANQLPMERAP
ncbi:MAG TPA: STAS domain-containing protein [Rhodocyclaceae bacterium]